MTGHRDAAQTALNSREFAAANVHALLYLADEQRVANWIALLKSGLAEKGLLDAHGVGLMIRAHLDGGS